MNPGNNGLPLADVVETFVKVFKQLEHDGYFQNSFGTPYNNYKDAKIRDVEIEIELQIHKKNIWPIQNEFEHYSEDDFFDMIEFLHEHISKPVEGTPYKDAWFDEEETYWRIFDKLQGQTEFRDKINLILSAYENEFELSPDGEVLHKPEDGLVPVVSAKIPSSDSKIVDKVNSAKLLYQRHKSSLEDRRHAVRDLIDVLEGLRPQIKVVFNTKDENDLFNIANNFGLRHNNEKQKTDYDQATWLGWMFYFYLITIHVVLRKINESEKENA